MSLGKGKKEPSMDPKSVPTPKDVTCEVCKGEGYTRAAGSKWKVQCRNCDGTGVRPFWAPYKPEMKDLLVEVLGPERVNFNDIMRLSPPPKRYQRKPLSRRPLGEWPEYRGNPQKREFFYGRVPVDNPVRREMAFSTEFKVRERIGQQQGEWRMEPPNPVEQEKHVKMTAVKKVAFQNPVITMFRDHDERQYYQDEPVAPEGFGYFEGVAQSVEKRIPPSGRPRASQFWTEITQVTSSATATVTSAIEEPEPASLIGKEKPSGGKIRKVVYWGQEIRMQVRKLSNEIAEHIDRLVLYLHHRYPEQAMEHCTARIMRMQREWLSPERFLDTQLALDTWRHAWKKAVFGKTLSGEVKTWLSHVEEASKVRSSLEEDFWRSVGPVPAVVMPSGGGLEEAGCFSFLGPTLTQEVNPKDDDDRDSWILIEDDDDDN